MRKTRFQKFVENHLPEEQRLPFLHVTNGYNFDQITLGDLLRPSECRVFEDEILYLFYGRPSYKTKQTFNHRLAFDWPVVFLFKYKSINRFVRSIFPFDSGAFHAGRYKYFFDEDSDIDDFRIRRGTDNVARIVSAFYRSNHEYFLGASTKNVEIPINQFEAAGVHELSRAPNHPEAPHHLSYDERNSSIEVSLKSELKLEDNIECLILPTKFLDVPSWREAVERWKPRAIKTYSVVHNISPEAFAGMIYNVVEGVIFDE